VRVCVFNPVGRAQLTHATNNSNSMPCMAIADVVYMTEMCYLRLSYINMNNELEGIRYCLNVNKSSNLRSEEYTKRKREERKLKGTSMEIELCAKKKVFVRVSS